MKRKIKSKIGFIMLSIILINELIGLLNVNSLKATYEYTKAIEIDSNRSGNPNAQNLYVIDEHGYLWVSGYNSYGELGKGDTEATPSNEFVKLEGRTYSKIAAGHQFAVALSTEGEIYTTGNNTYGQLGDGTTISKREFKRIKAGFKDIAAGYDHALAIDNSGNIWEWGQYDSEEYYSKSPKQVTRGTEFVKIIAGYSVSFAIDKSGNIWSWGKNHEGQLGRESGEIGIWGNVTEESLPITQGTILIEKTPTQITTGTVFKDVFTTYSTVLAVDASGNLWAWGDNGDGQFIGDKTIGDIIFLSGHRNQSKPIKILTGKNLESVAILPYYDCYAIDKNKNLWAWGNDDFPIIIKNNLTGKFVGQLRIDDQGALYKTNVFHQDGIYQYWQSSRISLDGTIYNVTLNTNGGAIAEGEELTSYKYGVGATLPIPTKPGYTFAGWYVNENLTGNAITTIGTEATGDKVYYAKWTSSSKTPYTVEQYQQNVTLDGYDLIGSDTYEGTTGQTVTVGVTGIQGFSVDENNTNNKLSGVVKADGSLVLKVYYDRSTYQVTLNTNGGAITEGEELTRYTYGVGATLPTPTKAGYTFAGWYKTEDLTGDAINTIGTEATGDKTYYAKWEEGTGIVYKVEHYKQNPVTNTYEKVATDELTGKTGLNVTARPKTYEGYHENTTHADRVASGIVSAEGNLVLKLYYDVNKYTVTFKNGDTVLSTQSIAHGTSAVAPEAPTKVGHTFTGWDKTFNNVTSNLTVNANWTVASYQVTLNTNGGAIAAGQAVTNYTYGVGVTLPTPTKAGYTFAGWYKTEDLTGDAITAIGTEATGDKTYYAKWNQNQYTVTFKDGDTVLTTQTVNHGATAVAPTAPTKAGYTFAGWDKEFSNVTSNLIVNAKWNKNQEEQPKQVGYKVEHYKQKPVTNTYEKVATEELTGTTGSNVTAVAKTYEGYHENTSHGERVANGNVSADGSLVLKLYYDINQYKVTFKDGDKVVKEETITHGGNVTPPILTKPGYILSWDKGTDNITGDTTFTAVWTKDPNYVDPNANKNDGKEEKPSVLPQTGESYIVIGTMSVLMSVAVLLYLKYKKMSNM